MLSSVLLLTACGNIITTDIRGTLGVTWNEAGNPEVIVQPCGLKIDWISVGGNEGTDVDLLTERPPGGEFIVDLMDADEPWAPRGDVVLKFSDSETVRFTGAKEWGDSQVGGILTTWNRVANLNEGEVLIGDTIDIDGNELEPHIVTRDYFSTCTD